MVLRRLLLKTIEAFDNAFIHEKLRHSTLPYRKAQFFLFFHLVIILISATCAITALLSGQITNVPNIEFGFVCTVLSLMFIRKTGNLTIGGNLVAFIYAVIVGEAVSRTGGLYSDNLLWLMLAPLLAAMLAGRASGVVWLLALFGYTYYQYQLETGGQSVYRDQLANFDHSYYLTSYLLLFGSVSLIVYLFMHASELLTKELFISRNIANQKAEALREAEKLLMEKNRELEEFAYAATHDLKEPLRMIYSYSSILNKRLDSQLDDASKEYLNYVTDGAKRMDKMLNDLMEYAKSGSTVGKLEEVDLNNALCKAIANLQSQIQETSSTVEMDNLPKLQCSETQLMRLFQNLIGNAIKFRRKDIPLKVEVRYQQTDAQTHRLVIKDNGIGIPEEHRERVFKVFEKLHAKSEYDGSGVGLASCKKIVNSLGGEITVLPQSECGTAFCIDLPIKGIEAKKLAINEASSTKMSTKTNPMMPMEMEGMSILASLLRNGMASVKQ